MRTKPTIAGLQREVDTLRVYAAEKDREIKALKDSDLHTREKLTELLDAYKVEYETNIFGQKLGDRAPKRIPQDWLGIAFLIGELRADANYSCVIDARESFRRESKHKTETINRLVKVLQENGLTFDFNEIDNDER